jgi:hypothetical protein
MGLKAFFSAKICPVKTLMDKRIFNSVHFLFCEIALSSTTIWREDALQNNIQQNDSQQNDTKNHETL